MPVQNLCGVSICLGLSLNPNHRPGPFPVFARRLLASRYRSKCLAQKNSAWNWLRPILIDKQREHRSRAGERVRSGIVSARAQGKRIGRDRQLTDSSRLATNREGSIASLKVFQLRGALTT